MDKFRVKHPDLDKLWSKLRNLEATCIGIIYNGLVHDVPKSKVLTELRNTIVFVAQQNELAKKDFQLLWFAISQACHFSFKKASNSLSETRKKQKGLEYHQLLQMRSEKVYPIMNQIIQERIISNPCTAVHRNVERVYKEKVIDSMLLEAEEKVSPFFLASAHSGCASDHTMYQGKMYYDKNYPNYIHDRALLDQIEAYIRNHKCLSFQEVMKPPVYFMTRPNCRHYFKNIEIGEVLSSSVNSILMRHGMVSSGVKRITYSKAMMQGYQERYKVHLIMNRIMPCSLLFQDIKKDRLLIRKWSQLNEETL